MINSAMYFAETPSRAWPIKKCDSMSGMPSSTCRVLNVWRRPLPAMGRPERDGIWAAAGEDKIIRDDFAVRLLTGDDADLARLHSAKSRFGRLSAEARSPQARWPHCR